MKKLFCYFSIILFLFSCSKPEETTIATELKLKDTSEIIEVDSGKNQVPISFVTNQSWTTSSDAKWIKLSSDKGSAGEVALVATVEENKTADNRSGVITITADNIKLKITIKQGKLTEEPVKETLIISVTGIDYTSYTVSITTNTTKPYFWEVIEKATWESLGGNEVWDMIIDAYKQEGALSDVIYTENSSYHFTNQKAQTEYVVFAAFCDMDGKRVGGIVTDSFTTDPGLTNDDMSPISLSVSNATKNSFVLSISTTSNTQYFFDVVEKTKWDKMGAEAVWTENVSELIKLGIFKDYLSSGNDSMVFEDLEPTQYVAYAAYCSNDGKLRSTIFTNEVDLSNLSTDTTPDWLFIKTDVALQTGQSYLIVPSCEKDGVKMENADIKWESSNPSVATVGQDGTVKAVKEGEAIIRVKATNGSAMDECTVFVKSDFSSPVDLGLSIKWAQCNLGANDPTKRGSLYYWGGVSSKGASELNWSYVPFNHAATSFDLSYFQSIQESVINADCNLLLSNDTAHLKLGGNWRMPTKAECEELVNNCSVERLSLNGQPGYLLRSKKSGFTNQWLFLSCVSNLYYDYDLSENYWSSTVYDKECYIGGERQEAYSRAYQINLVDGVDVDHDSRNDVCRIRPVYSNTKIDFFDIIVSNTTYSSFTISVSTNLPGYFFWGLADKSEWDQKGGATVCIEKLASYMEKGKLSVASGDVTLQYSSLKTRKDYVFFACMYDENKGIEGIGPYFSRFVNTCNFDY